MISDDKVRVLYEKGLSSREVAQQLDISHTTVLVRLRRSGAVLRDKSTSQRNKPREYARKAKVTKPCGFCGQLMIGPPSRIRRRKFCSNSCSAKSHPTKPVPRPLLKCEWCGKTYRPKERFEAAIRRFCCHACSRAWNTKHLKSHTVIERIVHSWLDEKRIPYKTQVQISRFMADIVLTDYPVVIECDGSYWHSLPGAFERDRTRNIIMRRLGYSVIRLAEKDIHSNPQQCKDQIMKRIADLST